MEPSPGQATKLRLVQLMLQFAQMPPNAGSDQHPAEAIKITAKVCQAVTKHTGYSMMTRSLRTVWLATQQAQVLLGMPVSLPLQSLPAIDVFAMSGRRTWAPLQTILLETDHGQYVQQNVTVALTTLQQLRDVHFFDTEQETDASLILKDANMLLQSVKGFLLLNEAFLEAEEKFYAAWATFSSEGSGSRMPSIEENDTVPTDSQ